MASRRAAWLKPMELPVNGLSEAEAYNVFTQVIIPRPVAWVLSDNGAEWGDERWNLAPFSYFNGITSAPPMVMFSIGNGLAGRQKGTHQNLTARPEFVISIPSTGQARSVLETSTELGPGISEVRKYGIELADWSWRIPRVRDAPVSLGCIARQFTQVGITEQIVVFAEIDRIWARDDVGRIDGNGRLLIDVKVFDPLARVGKGAYAGLTGTFRP